MAVLSALCQTWWRCAPKQSPITHYPPPLLPSQSSKADELPMQNTTRIKMV